MGELLCQPWGFCTWSGTLITSHAVMSWPQLDTRCLPSGSITLHLSRTMGAENKMKNLVSQNKSSLIKQSKGCVEAKEKCSLFSISHQHDVQPLLGKQGFSTHRGSSKRQIWIVMALFFVLSLSFYCRPDPVWHWITLWSPTLILPIRRLLMQGGHVGVPALMLCQHCPAVPKHRCVINTFLGTTAKHSTVRAAMGRTVSGRPNTHAPLNCTLVFSKR